MTRKDSLQNWKIITNGMTYFLGDRDMWLTRRISMILFDTNESFTILSLTRAINILRLVGNRTLDYLKSALISKLTTNHTATCTLKVKGQIYSILKNPNVINTLDCKLYFEKISTPCLYMSNWPMFTRHNTHISIWHNLFSELTWNIYSRNINNK